MKEVKHYKDEVLVSEMKVDEIKRDASKDKYDVKRYEDILNESYMMVPDASKRLQSAIADLASYISNSNSLLDSSGSWYQTAQIILQDNHNAVVDTDWNTKQVLETCTDDLADGESF